MNKYLLLDEDTDSVIDSCEANSLEEATFYFYENKGYRSGQVVDYDSAQNDAELYSFDESLFKAYIDKFSDEDLHKALILIGEKLNSNGYLKDFSYTQIKH